MAESELRWLLLGVLIGGVIGAGIVWFYMTRKHLTQLKRDEKGYVTEILEAYL
jgi:hypothetical protein